MKQIFLIPPVFIFILATTTVFAAPIGKKQNTKIAPTAPAVKVDRSPVVATVRNWTGPYVGLNVGYAFNGIAVKNGSNFTSLIVGVAGGGQAGYDFQSGNSVVGIVADASYSAANYSANDTSLTKFTEPYNASLRLRAGYLVNEETLFYLTGGYSVNRQVIDVSAYSINDGRLLTGYIIGAGLERLIFDNLSTYAEYRYSNDGSETYNFNGTTATGAYNQSEVRIGLNYRF